MTDEEILKALGLTKKSCLSEQIMQTTHHWLEACEKIEVLEKENTELKDQIKKMKCDVKQEQSYWNSGEMQYDLYQRLLDKWR